MVAVVANWPANGASFPYWMLIGLWPIVFVIIWVLRNMARDRRDETEVVRSPSWPQTEGTVISSKAVWAHLEVDCGYWVGDANYTGKFQLNLAPQPPSLSGTQHLNNEVKQDMTDYAPGTRLAIRYNPLNPRESLLYFRAPAESGAADSDRLSNLAPAQRQRPDAAKNWTTIALCTVFGLGLLAVLWETAQQEQRKRDIELQIVLGTDLQELYRNINADSFAGQLPNDVSVSWANLPLEAHCPACSGRTDWDTGKPRIRINTGGVRTEQGLRRLMEHEMCHVWVDAMGMREANDHGPLWQDCMKRFP
jgi:hypothetical protein